MEMFNLTERSQREDTESFIEEDGSTQQLQ